MYTFVEADSLDQRAQQNAADSQSFGASNAVSDMMPLRRPYRGIQIKDDTYAAISIWAGSKTLSVLRSESARGIESYADGTGEVMYYFDFIIQGVEDSRQEKMQVMETFGDPYVYFYGERPRFVTFRGVLINTEDFNWRSQFWYNYDRHLRGTKLVEAGARVYLAYDSIVVEGYPITAQATDNADTPSIIPFSVTMLVTNYFDFSEIGQTKFPGPQTPDNSAVNSELQLLRQNREGYVSTTAEVRARGLRSTPGGFLSEIRQGIRAINDITGAVSNFVDTVQDVIGGRNVRLPIGVAGFLSNVGDAVVAGGSIGNTFEQTMYDATTGTYRTVTGSVKLRMPGQPWFTKVASVTKLRGFKYENIDEYPLRSDVSSTLKDLLKPMDYLDLQRRELQRFVTASQQDIALELWNTQAEAGGLLSDLADGVSALKNGFGMVMSAIAFCKDPLGVLRSSLGLGLGYFNVDYLGRIKNTLGLNEKEKATVDASNLYGSGWSRSPTLVKQTMEELGLENLSPEAKLEIERTLGSDAFSVSSAEYIRRTLSQQGIKELAEAAGATTKSDTSFSERQAYIGAKAKDQNQKFGQVLEDERLKIDLFGDPDAELDVGVVYQSQQYQTQSFGQSYPAESVSYEEVYGPNDYETLAQRSTGATEAIQTIKEAYDDVFIDQPSEITEQAITQVYGQGYQSTQVRSAAEIADILRRMFGGQEQENETQEGIRGIDDEDAAIEPVR